MEIQPLIKNIFYKGQKLLSTKMATFICIAIAIISKLIVAWLYISLQGDKSLYLLLAKNLAATGLMRESFRAVENGAMLSLFHTATISPLYSFLSLPLLMFIHSAEAVSRILDVVAWVLFFIGLYKICRLLFSKRWITNLVILVIGLFMYPHELLSGPKDTLATAFTLFTVYHSYLFIVGRPALTRTLKLFLALIFLGSVKLLYVPIVPVIIAVLIAVALYKKQKRHLYFSGGLFIMVVITFGLIYTCLFIPSNQIPVSNKMIFPDSGPLAVAGFYPKNLLRTYPFLSASFFNVDLWGVQLQQWSKVSYSSILKIFRLADVLIFFSLLTLLIYTSRLRRHRLFSLLSIPALALIGFVFFLSLSHNVLEKTVDIGWTYVGEPRSFLFPIVCIQLLAFWLLFTPSTLAHWLKVVIVGLFTFASLHGFYFRTKLAANKNTVLEARHNNSPEKKVVSYLQKIIRQGKPVELVTFHNQLRRYATLQDINTFSFTGQPVDSLWMKQRHDFILATQAEDSLVVYKIFPKNKLVTLDTIDQYIIQRFVNWKE